MNWLKSGLSRRFAAVMGALALVPVLFLSWRMLEASQRGVQDAVLELHVKLAEKSAERLEGWVDSVDGRVGVALVALSARMDWADKQNLLKRLVESGAGLASISLLRRDGGGIIDVYNPEIEASSTALDPDVARAALRRALDAHGRAAEVLRGKSGPLLVLHYPFSKDVFARVVLPMRGIAERVASERVGGTGFAVLIDARGEPVAVPEGRNLTGLPSWSITRTALKSGNSVGSSEFTDSSGVARVGAYAPVPSLGGAVLILQLRTEAYLAASQARKAAGVAVIVVIVGALLAARYVSQSSSRL
ncbi:MAG: cache domain-containing protein, partial [Elusimicrobiota bacterium]